MKKPVIVICSSAAFYQKVNDLATELEKLGFTAVVPRTARTMAEKGDYDVSHYKTWYENDADYCYWSFLNWTACCGYAALQIDNNE